MDIVEINREKVKLAGDGSHAPGLKAILVHIKTAVAHLFRGQNTGDETAFTDAIYRTNQAFEGSLKEAYRVLTGKNPDKKTPYLIEEYFTTHDIFRSRVLTQFKNYRTEWRNPSTHDYKLDFDSSESFLAIVSVCAFTNVLLDQIIEKLAYDRSKLETESEKERIVNLLKESENDLSSYTANLIVEFLKQYKPKHEGPRMREAELLGSLSGFIESVAPMNQVDLEVQLTERGYPIADLLIERDKEKILVELKSMRFSRKLVNVGLEQLERYFELSGIEAGVLVIANYPFESIFVSEIVISGGKKVLVVAPNEIKN